MIEMYRYIQAEEVCDEYILINHTHNRLISFDWILFFSVGILLIIQILSYNHQDLGEFIFTFSLLAFTVGLNFFREKICHKTIKFNRTKGTVTFKRTLLAINETYAFSNIEINLKNVDFVDEDGYRFKHKSYFLKLKYGEGKYLICKSGPDMSFDNFIKKYMNSDERTLSNLLHYKREDDEELKKVFHM